MQGTGPLYPPGTTVEVRDPGSAIHGREAVVVDPETTSLGRLEPGHVLIELIGRPPAGTQRLWVVRESLLRA